MSHDFLVKLAPAKNGLIIVPHGSTDTNKIDPAEKHPIISWTLDDGSNGSLKGAQFNPISPQEPSPGFWWVGPPFPGDVCDHPQITGRVITIKDHHTGKPSRGTWHYQLSVAFPDQPPLHVLPALQSKNKTKSTPVGPGDPVIINR